MGELLFRNIPVSAATAEIAETLENYLQRGQVLLSLSGGSAIEPQIEILKKFSRNPNLLITLNDERYGPVGHSDSNWQQLIEAGLNDLQINHFEVLKGEPAAATTAAFNQFLSTSAASKVCLVSILGMGTDGHTSGVLPVSPALSSKDMAVYYEAKDFKRITNTPAFLDQQTEVWLIAYGEAKHQQLNLLKQDIDANAQPVQIIKRVPRATVYNNSIGENL